jgi:hypothetical protein
MGAPPLVVATRWWQAHALGAAGNHADAIEVAADAHAAARRLAIELPRRTAGARPPRTSEAD